MEDELQLVESMKQGDRDAFDRIYEKYCNQILRMAYLIVGNRADSEDITQETFIKCFLHCRELKNNAGFKAWLYQILTRTAWNYGKKAAREYPDEEIEQTAERTDGVSVLDVVVHKEQADELYKAISRLDMKYRTMIVYYYYNQMSTREIAAACNCLEGTVKSRLFTARGQLKKHLMKAEQEVSQYEESEQYGYANQPRTAQ
ncbi:MAG: RNA polymerase sigma factor [bacterium]|nr:RNA polymerase sigma factor [bacterium]